MRGGLTTASTSTADSFFVMVFRPFQVAAIRGGGLSGALCRFASERFGKQ
jgi:hypothetical protein